MFEAGSGALDGGGGESLCPRFLFASQGEGFASVVLLQACYISSPVDCM